MRSASIALRRLPAAAALLLVGWLLVGEAGSPTEPQRTPADGSRSPSGARTRPGPATRTPGPPAADRATAAGTGRATGSPRSRRRSPARPSRSIGEPTNGSLVGGVALPASGPHHVTWHPVRRTRPNPRWRRHATDRLVRLVLRIAEEHRRANAGAPRLLIGDLSRPNGGDFSARISGGLGHVSHQNGLDVDIYYPRVDRRLRAPRDVGDVDRRLAQDLVDRFVAAGVRFVFTGPGLRLRGPRRIVQPLRNHDDHLHVRLPG